MHSFFPENRTTTEARPRTPRRPMKIDMLERDALFCMDLRSSPPPPCTPWRSPDRPTAPEGTHQRIIFTTCHGRDFPIRVPRRDQGFDQRISGSPRSIRGESHRGGKTSLRWSPAARLPRRTNGKPLGAMVGCDTPPKCLSRDGTTINGNVDLGR